jgi:GH15 family glucan-1,4-alpha-glucosidase
MEPAAELKPGRANVGPAYGASPFPPIAEYGFLSDGEVAALVAPSGNVEWLCLPRFDSPSVFGSILDRDAGGFRFGPAEILVPAARRYLPGTNVLETSWGNSSGWIIIRDVLLIGPWRHQDDRSRSQRRAPTDYDAEHTLLRQVRCVNGEMQLTIDCEPVFEYGSQFGTWTYGSDGYREVRCRTDGSAPELQLTSDINLGIEGPRAVGRTLIKEGETRFVALSWGGREPPHDSDDAYKRLVWTAHHWQHWLARGTFPDHPWRSFLERSALTLKGLIYAPSGAVIAAPTTSLPETPGGERNWDYRYSWIRDSTFALWGLYTLGFDWEARDFLYFVAEMGARDELQVMYGVDGERQLEERTLDHLAGYQGARPVRVGNAAYKQRQHDVWGAMLDSVYLHATRDGLDEWLWPVLVRQVEAAIDHWQKPDRGIWEVRGEPRHFVSSKVMCWVALDRGTKMAELRDEPDLAHHWREIANTIRDDVLAHGVNKKGVLTQSYGSDALDASALLAVLFGFLPHDDKRMRATVLTLAEELSEGGLLLRYRVEETDDGLHTKEGVFTICSFWLVSALVLIGEPDRARMLCERLLSMASGLQLYGEELDPTTGRHLGNFPQAFTHLALINAVMNVIQAEETGKTTDDEPTPLPIGG